MRIFCCCCFEFNFPFLRMIRVPATLNRWCTIEQTQRIVLFGISVISINYHTKCSANVYKIYNIYIYPQQCSAYSKYNKEKKKSNNNNNNINSRTHSTAKSTTAEKKREEYCAENDFFFFLHPTSFALVGRAVGFFGLYLF